MERDLHPGKELDEIGKLGITAGISTPGDGDAIDIIGHDLQGSQGVLTDAAEGFPSAVVFPDAPAAVIAAHLVGGAVAAPEGGGLFHVLEIAVFAKTAAVDARPSSDINGEMGHDYI